MEVATREVWPDAKHRVCKWHVLKKAKDEFNEAINLPDTPDEFERAWQAVREKYGLKDNVFLDRMWDMREKWAPAYFKEFFFAKMSTTQRSERMNHVLKAFVRPSSSINGFVRRYDSFFYERIQAENTEEFHTFNVSEVIVNLIILAQSGMSGMSYIFSNGFREKLAVQLPHHSNCMLLVYTRGVHLTSSRNNSRQV